jgi:hypothetical protein
VTQPATATTPAVTTAPQQATGTTPVATIDGTDLKTLADNELACKQQTVELTSCQQEITLDQQKNQALTTEVTGLQKIKLEPAWKKTLKTIGQVALGIVIGRAKL